MSDDAFFIHDEFLPEEVIHSLKNSIRGPVHIKNDNFDFVAHIRVFNGNIVSPAKAVVYPIDAGDVSRLLKICVENNISPSVRAGGYGTAGWAVNGDIVIDLSEMNDIQIEEPSPTGSFTSLRDSAYHRKGKKSQEIVNSGKRRRSNEFAYKFSDTLPVVKFLSQSIPPDAGGSPRNVRLKLTHEDSDPTEGCNSEKETANAESVSITSDSNSAFTWFISSPNHSRCENRPVIRSGKPFGYLDVTPGPSSYPHVGRSSQVQLEVESSSMRQGSDHHSGIALPGFMAASAQPVFPHAYVTFGAGEKQKNIDVFCSSNPLPAIDWSGNKGHIAFHVPFAAHPVGATNMILGGFGFLSRLRGLSIDALVEAEMVLADGKIVIVNENENKDLWWAIRGAGPALGIVTRYKAKAYPVPLVYAGNLIFNFRTSTAPTLVKHFRDCFKSAPRELYANCFFTAGPAGKGSLVVMQLCYIGSREKGQEFLQTLSSVDCEQCLLNEVSEKSFLDQQDSVAQILRGKAGRQWFIRSALVTSLPDEIIYKTVSEFADAPLGCTWLFELAGGAVADAENTCLPKSQREANFTVAAFHQWEMDVHDDRCVESAEEWIHGTLGSVSIGGPYPSFLGRSEIPERVMACFGDNWPRLLEIKTKYDPLGLFRNTFWPLDVEGKPVEPNTHQPPSPKP